MFGFKKIIFVLVTTILLLGLVANPLTSLARPDILKVAVVDWDKKRWETQVIPSFNNKYPEVEVVLEFMSAGDLYARIMAIIDGCIIDCYDVVMMKSSKLPELSEYAEDLTKHRKGFESAGIDFVEYKGRILGVSLPRLGANQDWLLVISKNSKNRELALKLLKLAVKEEDGLLNFIPTKLAGFPDAPLSASFDPVEPFEGVQVPGGYAGRIWTTDREIAVAMVMDFCSPNDAAQQLAEIKPSGALDINLGDEGYEGKELLANGSSGFGVIIWRRGQFLIVVGGGILDLNGSIPSYQSLINLANDIDQAISDSNLSLGGQISLPPEEKALTSLLESSDISFPLVVSANSPIIAPLELLGKENGSISLRFETMSIESADCDDLEIRVYINEICLGDYDGDYGFIKGDGDIRVAGSIYIRHKCGKVSGIDTVKFTTKEIAWLGENECTKWKFEKYLDTVIFKQDHDTKPSITFDLLIADSDIGDASEVIKVVATLIKPKKAGKIITLIDAVRDKGQDTTGTRAGFGLLRESKPDELGEAHSKEPIEITRTIFCYKFNNPKSGWSTSSNNEHEKAYKKGEYSITVKKPNRQFISWAPRKSFPEDFEVKVNASQVGDKTGKYGILWGKDGNNYYVFTISSDGRYRLRKKVNGVWQKKDPVSWTKSPAIKRGTGSNQLKVFAIGNSIPFLGNSITLIVNDTILTTVKGSSFGPGKIGLVGGSFDDTGVEVQFDNLIIYD
jgi:hypothetical protein